MLSMKHDQRVSFGRRRSRLMRWVALGAATCGVAALAVSMSGPAMADPINPPTTYAAVGSDTIQDVWNQFANVTEQVNGHPNNFVGSWDATGMPDPITTKDATTTQPACTFTRPNGSTQGLAAILDSNGIPLPSGVADLTMPPPDRTDGGTDPNAACVDIGRSSSAPGPNHADNGLLQYIPFAEDAVTTATGPAEAVSGTDDDAVATQITHADDFTLGTLASPGDLISLYRDCMPVTVDGVTYDPNPNSGSGTHIHLYVPQPGSGTRQFWAATLGFDATTLPSCVFDHQLVQTGGVFAPTGPSVEEHDGTVYANDPLAFGPFSIAQFVAQTNGHNPRLHHVAIHNVDGVEPLLSGGTLNPVFPIHREVYNVVLQSRIDSTSPDANMDLINMLVGSGSEWCQDTADITNFGFALLDGTVPGLDLCGAVTNANRAVAPPTR